MTLIHVKVGLLLAVWLVGAPITAWAQGSTRERTFGTASTVSHTLGAHAFTGPTAASSDAFGVTGASTRFCSTVDCRFVAPLLLPAGAVVTIMELAACDDSPTGRVAVQLFRRTDPDVETALLATGGTENAATLGCQLVTVPLDTPETIDNATYSYFVQVAPTAGNATTRFAAVRIGYQLQVSPPPAAATFSDVPTNHPFFQFIEALVAAGITTGCNDSPPQFCPDGLVTRKQMAAFIARALGLHWAP